MNTSLLEVFRRAAVLELPSTGEPAERLQQFVTILFDNYDRQGSVADDAGRTERRSDSSAAQRDAAVCARQQLRQILRPAKNELRLPLGQAVTSRSS